MKKIILSYVFITLFQLLTCSGPMAGVAYAQESITNRTIVEMVQKGIPEEKIIAYIAETKGNFDLSATALQDLSKAGVSRPVIVAMEKTWPSSKVKPEPPVSGDTATSPRMEMPVIITGPCDACVRYRVVATGFVVGSGTIEGHLLRDGRGDEVYIAANVAEVSSANSLIGPVISKRSVNYGDTAGRDGPVHVIGIPLEHPSTNSFIVKAGSASPTTGGLLTGDFFPRAGDNVSPPHRRALDGRFIPYTLWEGDLRSGPNPNAVIILPTIWENDNATPIWDAWTAQAAAWLTNWSRNSSTHIRTRRGFLEREQNVMEITVNQNDFDRPIGISGGAFNPLAASPELTTFAPFSLFLTAALAEEAVRRGEIMVEYQDGPRYGPGTYKLVLKVERVPR